MVSMFTVTYTPCGKPVYEVEHTDWMGAGFPHPVTGEVTDFHGVRKQWIPEEDPSNRYGVGYTMMCLADGTVLRILND